MRPCAFATLILLLSACTGGPAQPGERPDITRSPAVGATAAPTTLASPASPQAPHEDTSTAGTTIELDDAAGDLTGPSGEPPDRPAPAADLRTVTVTAAERDLVIRFVVDGPVPESAPSLLWSIDLWAGDELRYTATAQLLGSRLVAGVHDWTSGEQASLETAEVDGSTLALRVPWELVPAARAGFTWQALGQAESAFEDRAPDGGRAPDPRGG